MTMNVWLYFDWLGSFVKEEVCEGGGEGGRPAPAFACRV
jgi:hypothetical protein